MKENQESSPDKTGKTNKLMEMIKKFLKGIFGRGDDSLPNNDNQKRQYDLEGLKNEITEIIKRAMLLKDEAMAKGDFLKSYVVESQIQALSEIKNVLDNPGTSVSDMSEIASRTDTIMQSKMAEISKNSSYKDLSTDYMQFDPKNIEIKKKEVMNEMSEIMKDYALGEKGNAIRSMLRETSDLSVGIIKNNKLSNDSANPFHSDLVTQGKLSSIQVNLIKERNKLIEKGDLTKATAVEFQRLSLINLEDPSKDNGANNELNNIINLPENKMMASAIATVSHAVNKKNDKLGYKEIAGQLTSEISDNNTLEKNQKESKALVSEIVLAANLGGLEIKVVEQIDESIGKVISSQVIETKDDELEDENGYEESGMKIS
jgi:hypothetical protein